MKFSIVIPVYNVEKYLRECLESVVKQTFTSFEIICVNDGSTDNSLEICKDVLQNASAEWQIISQENAGLSAARNAGILAAKGDYVFLLDSDDYIAENTLEVISQNIENEDFIAFNGERFFESGFKEKADEGIDENHLTGWEYYNKYALVPRRFHFVCAVLRCYRREFLLQNKLFFKKGIYHEDNLFTPVCCYYAENVKVIPNTLYFYRIREGSITQNISQKQINDIVQIANTLSDFFIPKTIDKTIIYSDLAFYYPNILILAKNADKNYLPVLYQQINWENYKKISLGFTKRLMFFLVKNKISLFYHYQIFTKIKGKINKNILWKIIR